MVCTFILSYLIDNPIIKKLNYCEGEQKQVSLKIQKLPKFHESNESVKLRRKTYYKVIPPKFEVETISFRSFDETKWTAEMDRYFKLVDEQIMVKKGGFKWIVNQNKENINLTYKLFPGEFINIKKVAIKPYTYCGSEAIKLDVLRKATAVDSTEEIRERERISKEIKKGYMVEQKQDIGICYANGTIVEITEKEYKNLDQGIKAKFTMDKGHWRIVKRM